MIDCIFTLDYEIYGNGTGSLDQLVYRPTQRLVEIFRKFNAHFVAFVEVAELEVIEAFGTDPAIEVVRRQIGELYEHGLEIALHIHPQWYNAVFEKSQWRLDYSEYNLCRLKPQRISQLVAQAIEHLRVLVNESKFSPVSFRAGNWLFQPTKNVAEVLHQNGIKIDSSVFKGGLQRNHKLDYRPALANGYFWHFRDDVNRPDATGPLLEIPTHSVMVPGWRLMTKKRIALQTKSASTTQNARQKLNRLLDLTRFYFPLKLDFCRMTLRELTSTIDRVILEDRAHPDTYKPIVAIGHTKDLVDFDTVETFLCYLKEKAIRVGTLQEALRRTGSTALHKTMD